MKTLNEFIAEQRYKSSQAFMDTHKKILSAGFEKINKHSSPGMYYYEHENGHTLGLNDTTSGKPEVESSYHNYNNIGHGKKLDSYLDKVKSGKLNESASISGIYQEKLNESSDDYNDRWNEKVGDKHLEYIHKKYGKKVDINFGHAHDDDGKDGYFSSKVYHKKHGPIYVTTHYDPKTLKVHSHTED